MAKKVTPEIIEEMKLLYAELGTYSAVAKELSVSASTVSKYLKEENSIKHFLSYGGPMPSDFPPEKEFVLSFSTLTQEEKDSLNKFMEEL